MIKAGSIVLLLLSSFCQLSRAQAIQHTVWWTYYAPITDTVTLRFGNDSSWIRTSTGADLLLSTFKLKDGIVTFTDYGGLNGCDNLPGSYHVKISADTLILIMAEDPCDARGSALIAKRWIRLSRPKK